MDRGGGMLLSRSRSGSTTSSSKNNKRRRMCRLLIAVAALVSLVGTTTSTASELSAFTIATTGSRQSPSTRAADADTPTIATKTALIGAADDGSIIGPNGTAGGHTTSTSRNIDNNNTTRRRTAHSSTPFERHYRSVYERMMIRNEVPARYVLFRIDGIGWGNKVRGLNGALFLSAITDRVLLVDTHSVTMLFHPPVVDGVVLDWNASLAGGVCDSNSNGNGTMAADVDVDVDVVTLEHSESRRVYAPKLSNFEAQYGHSRCIVVSCPFGHDRQVASLNEESYREKIRRLFGHPTSRYNWSREVLGLALQRPKELVTSAVAEAMHRLELDTVPQSHRVAIHLRTFFDMSKRWQSRVLDMQETYWNCVEGLLEKRVADLQEGGTNLTVSVLFASDNPAMKAEAVKRLTAIAGVRVIDSGVPITHSGRNDDFNSFLEWFLLGEAGTVVATGFSSYGLTAVLRPSTLPPTDTRSKLLFTVDRLGPRAPGSTNMMNPKCGEIKAAGYPDINFGINDPLELPEGESATIQAYQPNTQTFAGKIHLH